jgi:hypothetical protein
MDSHRDEDSRFAVAEWRAAVANDATRQSYRDWVIAQYAAAAADADTGTDERVVVLDWALSLAVDQKLAATKQVDDLAIRALHEVMVQHGWSEITVDVEEQSMIELVSTDDGSLVRAELDDEELREDLFSIAGNCPRRVYSYRDGEYRVTRQELGARIG